MRFARLVGGRAGLVLLALSSPLVFSAAVTSWIFGAWHRASNAPILSPQGNGWESAGTFNPAVVIHNGKFVMLYRAQDGFGTSRLGYAESSDGIRFIRRSEPVLSPETGYEMDGGVEDPRLVKIGDTYYLTYWLQQEGRTALPCHLQRPRSLGAQRRDTSRLQRQVERGVDQVRSHRP